MVCGFSGSQRWELSLRGADGEGWGQHTETHKSSHIGQSFHFMPENKEMELAPKVFFLLNSPFFFSGKKKAINDC